MSRPMYDDDDYYPQYTPSHDFVDTDSYYAFDDVYDCDNLSDLDDFEDFDKQVTELEDDIKKAISDCDFDLAERLEDEIRLLHLSLNEIGY
tara:strand:- start:703 stop:975 length:273 start_codon:yes stop_codon:yes gene_type:complete